MAPLISETEKNRSDETPSDRAHRPGQASHPALARIFRRRDCQTSNTAFSEYDRGHDRCRSCFPAGTEVLLADGTSAPIEQISVGDFVMGFDGSKQVPVRVDALESPVREHLCILSFSDGSIIRLTEEHPLYTTDGWRSLSPKSTAEENAQLLVGKLEIGDRVLTATGVYRALVDVSIVVGPVQTYNIKTVLDNFYVNGFLAHCKTQIALCETCPGSYADFACRAGDGTGPRVSYQS